MYKMHFSLLPATMRVWVYFLLLLQITIMYENLCNNSTLASVRVLIKWMGWWYIWQQIYTHTEHSYICIHTHSKHMKCVDVPFFTSSLSSGYFLCVCVFRVVVMLCNSTTNDRKKVYIFISTYAPRFKV